MMITAARRTKRSALPMPPIELLYLSGAAQDPPWPSAPDRIAHLPTPTPESDDDEDEDDEKDRGSGGGNIDPDDDEEGSVDDDDDEDETLWTLRVTTRIAFASPEPGTR